MDARPLSETSEVVLEPAISANPLQTFKQLQQALVDAAALGFIDNSGSLDKARPRRTGYWIAERLCVPGSWNKMHEKWLKSAYRAGFEHRKIEPADITESRRRSRGSR